MVYKENKPSRLRSSQGLRSLVRETRVSVEDFIMPVFFREDSNIQPQGELDCFKKHSEEYLIKEVESIANKGIKGVLLFGTCENKDKNGTGSHNEQSAFHKAIKKIKDNIDITVITDVCLCAYTDHGNCFVPSGKSGRPGCVNRKETLGALAKAALSYAKAGADIVAPSAMIDGQVKAIRAALDENDLDDTGIMSYSAKYASSFYGPFRNIFDSDPSLGDRKHHQMDPANQTEAIKEVLIDIQEGADIVMVKPAICYLDVISRIKKEVMIPVAAYNVSGEYSMIKAAAEKGWLDEKDCALEMLTSIKRAGADMIISYWAKEAAEWIR